MIKPMDVTPEVMNALDVLRSITKRLPESREALRWAITTLDEVGVFQEIDDVIESEATRTGYGSEEFREEMRREEISQHGEDLTDAYSPQEPAEPE